MPHDVIAPEIRTALEELDKRKIFLLDLQEAVEVAREFCVRTQWPKPTVSAFPQGHWPPILVFAFAKNIKAMAPHLAWLASNGYRQSAPAKDVPEMSMRLWTCGDIGLMVLLGGASSLPGDDDGSRCRYVEVGKKEVPIYELQCDDGTPADASVLPETGP